MAPKKPSVRSETKRLRRNRDNGLLHKVYKYGKLEGVQLFVGIWYTERKKFWSYASEEGLPWLGKIPELMTQPNATNCLPHDVLERLQAAEQRSKPSKDQRPGRSRGGGPAGEGKDGAGREARNDAGSEARNDAGGDAKGGEGKGAAQAAGHDTTLSSMTETEEGESIEVAGDVGICISSAPLARIPDLPDLRLTWPGEQRLRRHGRSRG